ncbi:TPA: hypothetical protein RJI64_004304 [Yersinia enterocolitica]|nr:hypothetical protein [Yersinia enterocolitica]HDV7153992.1 hypothetical protein [Yersinia enterocolitica]HED5569234.1 hypothetical protein [Yersinia enterocolitica]
MITLILVAAYFWMAGMVTEYSHTTMKNAGKQVSMLSVSLIGIAWPAALFYWGIGARR